MVTMNDETKDPKVVRAPICCPSCGSEMQSGFIAELGDLNIVRQVNWHAGEPEPAYAFGLLKVGGLNVDEGIPVYASRCNACGRLEFFAQ